LQPVALKLWLDESGRQAKAGCNDVLFLYVAAVDQNGTIVPGFNGEVKIDADKDIEILNQGTIQAEAGIATALIRIKNASGNVAVSAKSENLKSGDFRFEIAK